MSYRNAKQTVIKPSQYAYRVRKNKKRDFRELWITRINAGVGAEGYTYSQFTNQLNKKDNKITPKMISDLAVNNEKEFKAFVHDVMKQK